MLVVLLGVLHVVTMIVMSTRPRQGQLSQVYPNWPAPINTAQRSIGNIGLVEVRLTENALGYVLPSHFFVGYAQIP